MNKLYAANKPKIVIGRKYALYIIAIKNENFNYYKLGEKIYAGALVIYPLNI